MDYYYKYKKYKTKYLELMGNNMTLIICGTHGMRMVCFLKSLFPSIPAKIIKNCSIIRCYTHNNTTILNMIYEGESNHTNDWTMNDINKYFTTSINISLPANTELFFVRHGHGQHNDINIIDRMKTDLTDAMLTPAGVSQAERAGGFLASYINMNYNNPNIFFEASTLRRTMQTIAIIMNKLYIEKPIHITPCVNELPYRANGNCDILFLNNLGNTIFKENQSVCSNNMNGCDIIHIKYKNFNIKWEYYMKFKENNNCKNTNIINQILECYNFYNNPNNNTVL